MRRAFAETHPGVVLFDGETRGAIEAYLCATGLATPDELPVHVAPAGAGNMNVTLRVRTRRRSMILKQCRPWAARYPHIAAPWNRTAIEARFYQTVAAHPAVAVRLPAVLHWDPHNHVLMLEDLGAANDCTTCYAAGDIAPSAVAALLEWLGRLSEVRLSNAEQVTFSNRAMRALNHEHIFVLPLVAGNGVDLDAVTAGLEGVAVELRRETAYGEALQRLGGRYLADGPHLVHGDFFPGSWLTCHNSSGARGGGRAGDAVRIIDPEFCFAGAREFDYGVVLAHLALARCDRTHAITVLAATAEARLDSRLVCGFAGAEIMRRLIGVAQLPLRYDLDEKASLLALSVQLVLFGDRSLDWW